MAAAPATLSEDQIEQLLQEAEARLRVKAGADAPTAEDADEVALEVETPETKHRKRIPRLEHGLKRASYIKDHQGVAKVDASLLADKDSQKSAEQLRTVEVKKQAKKHAGPSNSGPSWFSMPATDLTPQLKRDLQMISLRSVLDPHRHYKKTSKSKSQIPQFSQTGTVIEGPAEFYSSRINKKDRAKSFVEEAMVAERESGRFKRKYSEIQEKKMSGKKAHYKRLIAKRKKR